MKKNRKDGTGNYYEQKHNKHEKDMEVGDRKRGGNKNQNRKRANET